MNLLIVGIGNEFRGDDGVGIFVARKLRETGLPGAEIREESGEGTRLMEIWKDAHTVLLVDSVSSGAPSGTIHHIDARNERVPAGLVRCSTHAFGVAEAVELARALRELPPRLFIYGIDGQDFSMGTTLSPKVAKSALEVVRRIADEVSAFVG
jgi:hydrogenase maturation protease